MTKEEFKPIGGITLSNAGGIEIMVINKGNCIAYRFNYGQNNLEEEEIFEAEIKYKNDGDPYFLHGETEYSLSEAIRF